MLTFKRLPRVPAFAVIAAALALLCPAIAAAAATVPAGAVNVQRLVPAQPSGSAPGRIGVLVFFDFSPASQRLLQRLKMWAANAGDSVVVDREPLASAVPEPLVRGFVVARTLGIESPVLPGLFQAGAGSLKPNQMEEALSGVFQRWGIDPLEFHAAWKSAAANASVIRARALAQRFGVKGAPAIIVNGTWRLVPDTPGDVSALLTALNRRVAAVSSVEARNQ